MKYQVAAVLAALFVLAPAEAQQPPNPPIDEVEETETTEDKAREAREEQVDDRARGVPPGQARAAAPAADAKPPKWDVNAPPGATVRQAPIVTDEGTWMNVDVSPDGRTIAFDLLGDIYTMPIAGGAPTRIAEGLAFEVHPRFSPDGRRIAFTSDRGGGDNIWIMNADGSDKRQLTKESFRLLNQPTWSPDGRFIAAKKHFTTGRSLGTGEVWLYHVSGGDGVVLVKKPNEQHQKELGEPIYAPDGESIYYTRNTTPGAIFEYAQDSNKQVFAIERYDLATGEVSTAVSGAGGSVRPTPSPDGKKIAFVRRERAKSKLYVKDLTTGEERKLYDALDQDVQETWAVHGVYPNMDWTPDSRGIVFWAGGKLRRVDADGSNAQVIPFRIADSRGVIAPPRPTVDVAPASFSTDMPRFATVSPDGRQIVFESLGKLWIKPASGGAPKRLTRGGEGMELFPSWSRDGRSLLYVDWTDAGLGRIRTISSSGGNARDVTTQPGHYFRPRFSPDGRTIIFEKKAGGGLTDRRGSDDPGVYRVAASGGAPVRVAKGMSEPQFGAANDRVFMVENADNKRRLVSTDLSGEAKRIHATGELVSAYEVAPNGEYFAFRESYEAFVMPLLPGNQEVGLTAKGGPLPATRVSASGADYIHWAGDSSRLHWSMGPTLYSASTDAFFRQAPAAEGETPAKFVAPTSGASLAMQVEANKPTGLVALTGARVVTMAAVDGGVIDTGVVLIEGDRIRAVGGPDTAIPAGAKRVDVSGKTIIPGLVDAHAHGPYGTDDLIPQQNWSSIVNLALGTTTIHDPSSDSSEVFAASELQRAGRILAPRTFSTGEIVYGAKNADIYAAVDGIDDARAHVKRLKVQGAYSVKNYNQPRRDQRQQVVAASREEGMQVVAEGGSLFGLDMSLIADGNTTLEHNIPQMVLYKDVVDFFAGSGVGYTPTLVVTYGGPAGDPYWRSHTNVFEHPILQRHVPPTTLAADNARRTIAPEGDYVDDDSAREAKKLADAGVLVSIGAHGQEAGIGPHWELWSFVRGGMTPVEALRAGTIVAAQSLGMAKDIGSIEPGKLADLVVLDADPTADIRNSDKVRQVMLGGRLYDSATMNEVVTGDRKRAAYWWE